MKCSAVQGARMARLLDGRLVLEEAVLAARGLRDQRVNREQQQRVRAEVHAGSGEKESQRRSPEHGLVERGNTVVVIEHNLDVVKTADWVIDLGPEGGDAGGYVIGTGTPEEIAELSTATGQFVRKVLDKSSVRTGFSRSSAG